MSKCDNCGFENEEDEHICRRCHYLLKEYDVNEDNVLDDMNNDESGYIKNDNPFEKGADGIKNTYTYDEGYYLLDHAESIINEEDLYNPQKKSVLLGCLLSFFITGIGNVYAGLTKRGIVEFVISLLINSFIPVTPDFLVDLNSYILYLALIWEIYVIYDTYRCIKAINSNQEVPLFLKFINLK